MKEAYYFMIVAADHLVRAGLTSGIEELPDCTVVSQANPVELLPDIATAVEETAANIMLWDWGLDTGDPSAIDFQEIEIPVIILLADALQANEVWSTGANALIRRDSSPEKILAAASAVKQGLAVIEPEFTFKVVSQRPLLAEDFDELPTVRELQVLQLMAEGLTNKAIAQKLGISQHTAKFHVNSILTKLNAQSRTEAVVLATRLGFIAL